ncbi:MAG: TonB family protein [Bacillota bacterium]
MSTHASALPVGYKLDEYLIGRLLGHGGFGLTYLAQDTNLNALVAIKEFLPQEFAVRNAKSEVVAKSEFDADSYKWGLERFKEEARALARFKHPNIVRVARLIEANGTAYMVMDFEPGLTLSQYLKRNGPTLEEGRLLGIFLPVLDGLEALHRLQLVHRDIKPSNIYVRAYGGPMLIDFGAVRQAIGAQSQNLTSLVTPGYAPIEQYSSDGRQGAWSDLYAVGASIYYCMFGHAPADAARRSATMSDGAEDPYVSASVEGKDKYSRDLLDCVDWALKFKQRDRPQSAHEFRERLRGSPVPPQIIEVPESLAEVPELQHGVMSAPTLPAHSQRVYTSVQAPSANQGLPGATAGDSTVISLPTRGGDSLVPLIEGTRRPNATEMMPRTSLLERFKVQARRLGAALEAQFETANQDPSTLTSRLTKHLREPRGLRIALTALIMIMLATSIFIYSRRTGNDQHLYDTAAAANTVAAYQAYLGSCGSCAHQAEAEDAVARLQRSATAAQANALQSRFRELLAKKQLAPPTEPNAQSVLEQLAALDPNGAELPGDRSDLDAALKAAQHPVAKGTQVPPKRVAIAKPGSRPAASNSPLSADSVVQGEVLPKPIYSPAPKYPQAAKGMSGYVVLEFNVNVDGSTSSVEVVDSSPKGVFDDVAMHAVHSWMFSPDTVHGSRQRKRIRYRLEFKP